MCVIVNKLSTFLIYESEVQVGLASANKCNRYISLLSISALHVSYRLFYEKKKSSIATKSFSIMIKIRHSNGYNRLI